MTSTKMQIKAKAKRKNSRDTLEEHKVQNQLLSLAYEDFNPRKAQRLRDCAPWVTWVAPADNPLPTQADKKLVSYFCHVRLCPVCAWRRSLKIGGQMNKIIAAIEADKPMAYIMLTLTVKSCKIEDLSSEIDKMMAAFNRLKRYKAFDDAVKGYYRGFEVTHNLQRDDMHPHFHCLIAVNRSYFSGRDYVKHAQWQEMWRKCMLLDYDPDVHIKRVKGKTSGGIAEVAKYASEAENYIIPDDWDLTVDTVRRLDLAFHHRRFVALGGVFKDWHKRLNLDDPEDGDLSDEIEKKKDLLVTDYAIWHTGYNQYIDQKLR